MGALTDTPGSRIRVRRAPKAGPRVHSREGIQHARPFHRLGAQPERTCSRHSLSVCDVLTPSLSSVRSFIVNATAEHERTIASSCEGSSLELTSVAARARGAGGVEWAGCCKSARHSRGQGHPPRDPYPRTQVRPRPLLLLLPQARIKQPAVTVVHWMRMQSWHSLAGAFSTVCIMIRGIYDSLPGL